MEAAGLEPTQAMLGPLREVCQAAAVGTLCRYHLCSCGNQDDFTCQGLTLAKPKQKSLARESGECSVQASRSCSMEKKLGGRVWGCHNPIEFLSQRSFFF